jgi:hypothetical protein
MTRATRRLLALGAAAGPFYIVVGLLQMFLREGFDPRRHALSLLSNGDRGWVQIANFLVSGGLVLAGAIGIRRACRAQPAGTWAPVLLTFYALGLVGAGIFRADPADGFPPGAPPFHGLTRSGLLHFVCGGIGFYAVIAACFVFARRFARARERGFAWWSIATGVVFFIAFAGVASGAKSAAVMLTFYVAVAWLWIWHVSVHLHVRAAERSG